jgi:hypothetical protein
VAAAARTDSGVSLIALGARTGTSFDVRAPQPKAYHVVFGRGGWKVSAEDVSREPSRHETKEAAVAEATQLARAADLGQVIVHGVDGSIESEHTFGENVPRRA